jgi:hypothetical protein
MIGKGRHEVRLAGREGRQEGMQSQAGIQEENSGSKTRQAQRQVGRQGHAADTQARTVICRHAGSHARPGMQARTSSQAVKGWEAGKQGQAGSVM